MKSTAGGYVLGRGDPHGRQMRSAPPRLELKKAEFEGNFMIAKKRIFVAGGAGNQGGAVISALLERGHEARTMARDPQADGAAALAKRGVEVVPGDMADPAALRRAMASVDGAYLMTTFFEKGVDGEVLMGRNMLDAAKADNVGHVVLSSVGGADRNTGIPHFDSKYRVERYAREIGAPVTVSAPAYFMDNVFAPWNIDVVKTESFGMAMPGDRPLQQIAVRNIGEFAVALFERGEKVVGERYDIAGDELSGAEMARQLSEALGRTIKYSELPIAGLRAQSEDTAVMFEWLNAVGYSADIDGLRREFSDVNWLRFADWAKTQSLG